MKYRPSFQRTICLSKDDRCHGINFDKRKEIVVANKGLKQLRKVTKGLSSSAKGAPARRFGAKAVEPHGLTWFNIQKEAKYSPENWIDEGHLALEFPTIRDKVCELGLGYILPSLRSATSLWYNIFFVRQRKRCFVLRWRPKEDQTWRISASSPTSSRGQRRRYGTQWIVDKGRKWYAKHKESKYFPNVRIDRESLA
ncbi:hypothetical protein HAX54_012336 [Datura stramonium]|uniref:Uncharacterized protein n=1 Tax=Datura stramonium TaxID=4076 RepID=A0ABS8TJL3_DATST|nr:hypothetical protein [Datura stramonium]